MPDFSDTISRAIGSEDGRKADLLFIAAFTVLCLGRLLWLLNVYVDDNCWLLSMYNTPGLSGFLDTGFRELRCVPQGVFLYGLFVTHTFLSDAVFWWQALNLVMQGLTGAGIYLLVRALPGNFRFAAFASAVFFLIAPVDTTLPVFSNLTRRAGLLTSIFSLILTVKAVETGRKARYLLPALLVSALTNYLLIEGAMSLEPGRFLLMAALFRQKGESLKGAALKALKWSLAFGLSLVPLAVFKMLYKPFGLYGGYYETGVKFIFRYSMWKQAFKHFCFDNWKVFRALIEGFPFWAALLGLAGGLLAWVSPWGAGTDKAEVSGGRLDNRFAAALGLALLVFPLMFYMYAGKVPTYGIDSRHGVLMQLGNAVMLGGLLAWLAVKTGWKAWLRAWTAALFAVGVFFSNVNLDQYFKTWEHQKTFWRAFAERFPELPPKADFLMGVDNHELLYRYYGDYDFEYPLNMLYSREGRRGDMRPYRVVPAAELAVTERGAFKRLGHFGEEVFDTATLIPVGFKDGRFYSGKETAVLGGVFKALAGNPLPGPGGKSAITYPLRRRAGYLE